MRFAIFGDIHANYHALEVILTDAKAHMCSHHVCMGDIVGYNAFPKECIEVVRKLECPGRQRQPRRASFDARRSGKL